MRSIAITAEAMLLRNFGVMKWAMGFHKESLELFEEVPGRSWAGSTWINGLKM